ncbi:MAG: bacteriohemerythrin [Alphaproteobacteria bacterium]|nr:bacteriohemerythrin [Alphaproteobacteria bacterium]
MTLLQWNEDMSVGIAALDDEHKRLFALFHEIHNAIQENHGPGVLNKIVKGLIAYTLTHFRHEEDLFAQTGYPGAAAHQKEHQELSRRVHDIQAKCRFGPTPELAREVFGFLQFWLSSHVLQSDKKFGPYLNSKGIH